jgi:hypothetical protein
MCALRRYPVKTTEPRPETTHNFGVVLLDKNRVDSIIVELRKHARGVRAYAGSGLNQRQYDPSSVASLSGIRDIKITSSQPCITIRFGPSIAQATFDASSNKAASALGRVVQVVDTFRRPIIPRNYAYMIAVCETVWILTMLGIGKHSHISLWLQTLAAIFIFPSLIGVTTLAVFPWLRIKRQGMAKIQTRPARIASTRLQQQCIPITARHILTICLVALAVGTIINQIFDGSYL